MVRSLIFGLVLAATLVSDSFAGGFGSFGGHKVQSLGKFQQNTIAHGFGGAAGFGAGIVSSPFVTPVGGAVVGAGVSHVVGNHAERNWTGKGLQNWNKPHRW